MIIAICNQALKSLLMDIERRFFWLNAYRTLLFQQPVRMDLKRHCLGPSRTSI
jgi:hypothetical protein